MHIVYSYSKTFNIQFIDLETERFTDCAKLVGVYKPIPFQDVLAILVSTSTCLEKRRMKASFPNGITHL